MTIVIIYNNSHSFEVVRMYSTSLKFLTAAITASIPFVASAQYLPQPDGYDILHQTAQVLPRPYEFAILGVKPGMPIAEALALIEEHLGKELSPVGGTLQVTSPEGVAFRTELRVGYETPGIDFFLRNQSQQPFDSIKIDVSTPTSGSVVTAIQREVRVAASDGPDGAALLAQLEGLYGQPSDHPGGSLGQKWRWAMDRAFEPIAMPDDYNPVVFQACSHSLPSSGRYAYRLDLSLGESRNCGVSYVAEHIPQGETITMNFRLIDYNLLVQDHLATNAQIDEKLNADTQPSDMKL